MSKEPPKHLTVLSSETPNIKKFANLTANTKNYGQTALSTTPHSDPLRILISLPYHQLAKIPYSSKLSFLTVTLITDNLSPFRNFQRKFNLGFHGVLFNTILKRILCFIVTYPGNILHLWWLKAWLPMVSSTVKNGKDRLRKENRLRRRVNSNVYSKYLLFFVFKRWREKEETQIRRKEM